jgi:hypothetical protein
VVRAIEDYDRLGQDRFLAEHGFGRATAYLLIYRGRSYDSKAILGVAYKYATGVRIGSHEFSGGTSGAAGVLRRLGFEVRDMRAAAAQRAADRAGPGATLTSHASATSAAGGAPGPAASLDGIDPERALLVLTCSARKETGGRPAGRAEDLAWSADLRDARRQVLATANADTARVLPAWRRYTGTFYQHARPALAAAAATGHVVIISGGYGIARGEEPIGWYDKILQLTDWPTGLLESALVSEARRCGAHRRGVRPGYHRLRQAAPADPLATGRHRCAAGQHHRGHRRCHGGGATAARAGVLSLLDPRARQLPARHHRRTARVTAAATAPTGWGSSLNLSSSEPGKLRAERTGNSLTTSSR